MYICAICGRIIKWVAWVWQGCHTLLSVLCGQYISARLVQQRLLHPLTFRAFRGRTPRTLTFCAFREFRGRTLRTLTFCEFREFRGRTPRTLTFCEFREFRGRTLRTLTFCEFREFRGRTLRTLTFCEFREFRGRTLRTLTFRACVLWENTHCLYTRPSSTSEINDYGYALGWRLQPKPIVLARHPSSRRGRPASHP